MPPRSTGRSHEPKDPDLVAIGRRLRELRTEQGLTQEALADVEAGRVIDHLAVQAWADSLSTDQPLSVPR